MFRKNNKPEKVKESLLENGFLSHGDLEKKELAPGRYHKQDLNRPYGFIQGLQGSYDVYNDNGKQFILGKGGTSIVKLIQNRKTGEWRALKIIYAHTDHDTGYVLTAKDAKLYYEREYRILNKLNRIDPARIQTKSKSGVDKYQIIMDLAEGEELFVLIREKRHLLPKDPKKLLQLALNILIDLFITHQAGILLIDDKGENIIVNPNTLEIVRIDFGFAHDDYDFKSDKGIKTMFRGTLETSAPELLEPRAKNQYVTFSKATDIYTVGAVLRELLLGEDFILEEDKHGKIDYVNPKILISKARRSSITNYPNIKQLLLNMTSHNPQKRPSLEEVIEQFEEVLGLKKGSSITLKKQLLIQPTAPIVSDLSHDEKKHSNKKLTDNQIKEVLEEYKQEKDGCLKIGVRWYFTSIPTFKAIFELTNHKKHFLTNEDKIIKKSSGKEFFIDDKKIEHLLHIENDKYYYYEQNNDPIESDYEQKQYEKAKKFITDNPHSTFAKKLAYAMHEDELIEQVKNARPFWRRCCS